MAIDWTTTYQQYKGKWVALADDEQTVIVSGDTVQEVMERSKEKGIEYPILFRVPTQVVPYIGLS